MSYQRITSVSKFVLYFSSAILILFILSIVNYNVFQKSIAIIIWLL